ncbi:hypothetical protein V6N11_044455 [Hibiscus sabdariffa]|uniref:Uncharacterized protein n=1 Tax=Hibiscus sabdariffa TaxID=183260 RepID=A0ABR2RFA8_9ROSI
MHASISVDQEQPPLPPEPANVEDQVASDLDSAQPLRTELILVASPSLPVLPSSTRPSKTHQVNPRVDGLHNPSTPLTCSANGRPPDFSPTVIAPMRLEWLSNHVSVEDQQVVKRSQGDGEDLMDT